MMPLSDDEFDSRQGFDQDDRHHSSLSKAELRKTNKPIMEKKRRARINQCLSELKDLILEAMKKDPARHSKLEKADILEMTVRHLQAAQRRGLAAAAAADGRVLPRFRQGFAECAGEASRFLARPPALAAPARQRLRTHLAACVAALQPAGAPPPDLAPPELLLPHESHLSAFQAVRAACRPPSPATSESSCDSLASQPGTPPRRNVSSTFPTPPSQNSLATDSSPETQKPTVSSTTISPETKAAEQHLWRQTDVLAYQRHLPLPIHSSTELYSAPILTSPKLAIDYSLTPCSGKKRPRGPESVGLLAIVKQEPPAKVCKIACAKVSSSQSLEEACGRQGSPLGPAGDKKPTPPTAGPAASAPDMWRPW